MLRFQCLANGDSKSSVRGIKCAAWFTSARQLAMDEYTTKFFIILRRLVILFNGPPKPGACWRGRS